VTEAVSVAVADLAEIEEGEGKNCHDFYSHCLFIKTR